MPPEHPAKQANTPGTLRALPKTASEKGTVPFCSEDSAKSLAVPGSFRMALATGGAGNRASVGNLNLCLHGRTHRRIGNQAEEFQRRRAGVAKLVNFIGHDKHHVAGTQPMLALPLQHHSLPLQHEHLVLVGMAMARRVSARSDLELPHGERGG